MTLKDRISVLVMLFLSLSAVQFVIINIMPPASYVLPMQDLALMTYLLYVLLVFESVLVCYIADYKENHDKRAQHKAARLKTKAKLTDIREQRYAHEEKHNDMLHLDVNAAESSTAHDHLPQKAENQDGAGVPSGTIKKKGMLRCMLYLLSVDEAYGSYVAVSVDFWCATVIFLLYCIGVILIFVLGSGLGKICIEGFDC